MCQSITGSGRISFLRCGLVGRSQSSSLSHTIQFRACTLCLVTRRWTARRETSFGALCFFSQRASGRWEQIPIRLNGQDSSGRKVPSNMAAARLEGLVAVGGVDRTTHDRCGSVTMWRRMLRGFELMPSISSAQVSKKTNKSCHCSVQLQTSASKGVVLLLRRTLEWPKCVSLRKLSAAKVFHK